MGAYELDIGRKTMSCQTLALPVVGSFVNSSFDVLKLQTGVDSYSYIMQTNGLDADSALACVGAYFGVDAKIKRRLDW